MRADLPRKGAVGDPGSGTLTLHRHQPEAIEVAKSGESYVLTTGTGSGKSLAYIVPIVDAVLRRPRTRGVKAIIVYPMNALANSQVEEQRKFLQHGYGEGYEPVTSPATPARSKERNATGFLRIRRTFSSPTT